MNESTERTDKTNGEAERTTVSEEVYRTPHDNEDTGVALLQEALTRENLKRAFKRVRANKSAAGVDGLDIDQTARYLVSAWPMIHKQLLKGTYRTSPVSNYIER